MPDIHDYKRFFELLVKRNDGTITETETTELSERFIYDNSGHFRCLLPIITDTPKGNLLVIARSLFVNPLLRDEFKAVVQSRH